MKKFNLIALSILAVAICFSMDVSAQSKALKKAQNKEFKKKTKEWNKQVSKPWRAAALKMYCC